MPQLDKVTFLSQFFWLCFFYLGFYYVILKYFLPKMARILKFRQKKMNLSQEGVTSLQQENKQIRLNYDNLLSKGLSTSKNLFNENFQRTSIWLNNVVESTNKTHYQVVNNTYIHSIGENSLSQNLLIYHTSQRLPEEFFTKLIVDKINFLKNSSFFSKKKSEHLTQKKKQISSSSNGTQEQNFDIKKMKKGKK